MLHMLSARFAATPAWQRVTFFSLSNTDFVVSAGVPAFHRCADLLQSPGIVRGMLDKRADGIKSELEEARALREEAQTLLASYERKQKEVQEQADRIVTAAKEEAQSAAEQARADLAKSLDAPYGCCRRSDWLGPGGRDQGSARSGRSYCVRAARDVIAKQMTAAEGNALIDSAIAEVDAKLH